MAAEVATHYHWPPDVLMEMEWAELLAWRAEAVALTMDEEDGDV
ncbi:MAG: GpE family phage tail protein [Tepidamorphaceae bacterium]